ncbi:MAG TPA: thermonuclease family protein [Planctomycetota bacterium]|nr:thermonuclease family protein [Planctomycetota bacterium]
MRIVLVLVLVLGCESPPPPQDTTLLARVVQDENKLDARDREVKELQARVDALEKSSRPANVDQDARIAALEAKLLEERERVVKLEEKLELLAAAKMTPPPPKDTDGVTIIDRKRPSRALPAAGEVVKPVATISGETFSFVHEGRVDLARLVGVETPLRAQDDGDERKKRQLEAWGEKFDAEAGWEKARARLEELLGSGDVSFAYADEQDEKRGVSVYVQVKKKDGTTVVVNELLLKEGLALSRGLHGRRSDFDKLEEDARAAKRGFFAGR